MPRSKTPDERTRKRTLRAGFIGCLAVMAFACNGAQPQTRVLVMIDFSVSARSQLSEYQSILNTIVEQMPPRGRLVAGKIVDTTLASFRPFLDEEFPDENFLTSNPIVVKEQREALLERMAKNLNAETQDTRLSSWTNIVSALAILPQVYPGAGPRVLVLVSDMMHSTSEFDLEKDRIDDAYVERVVERLRKAERLPRLGGVVVYVAGATAPTEERYLAVKKFWERIMAETGAEMRGYGRSLMNFRL